MQHPLATTQATRRRFLKGALAASAALTAPGYLTRATDGGPAGGPAEARLSLLRLRDQAPDAVRLGEPEADLHGGG